MRVFCFDLLSRAIYSVVSVTSMFLLVYLIGEMAYSVNGPGFNQKKNIV